jgi:hypothetical protein
MNGMIDTKIHLDQLFALEGLGHELQELKVDIVLQNNPNKKTSTSHLPYMNTMFLYYLATALLGLSMISTKVL